MMLLFRSEHNLQIEDGQELLALLAEKGLFIMTVLSEKALHCCRASDSSSELIPEEGGDTRHKRQQKMNTLLT